MASTIKLKNGSGAPLASDLVQGEPALDLTNKRLYTEDSGGTVIEVGTNPTELQVDNINIDGNAITSTDTDGNIAITPNGTGEVDISKVDIDGGAIDGTVIGGTTTAAGSFTTLQADTSLNVDGTVTADGLTVDTNSTTGAVKIQSGDNNTFGIGLAQIAFGYNGTNDYQHFIRTSADIVDSGNKLEFLLCDGTQNNTLTSGTTRALTLTGNGDISFYEDTGTTAKFFWDASAERLGIGTTSPLADLHISSTSNTNLMISDSNAAADTKNWDINVDGSSLSFRLVNDANNAANSWLTAVRTGYATANVGIGTSSPSAGLHIDTSTGKMILERSGTGFDASFSLISGGLTGGGFRIRDEVASSDRLTIDSSGDVGIGTSSPSALLEISKDDRANGATLRITNSAASSSWTSGDIVGTIDFYSSDASDADVRSRIQSVSTAGATNPGSVDLTFSTFSNSTLSERMRIDSSGNVGIGTTPSYNLHVKDDTGFGLIVVEDSTSTYQGLLGADPTGGVEGVILGSLSNHPAIFRTNNTERMRLNSDGSCRWTPDGTNADMTLDASGNLLAGKTITNTLGTVGHDFGAVGYAMHTRASSNVLYLNRTTSDGNIAEFYKDGATVGSIESFAGVTTGLTLRPTTQAGPAGLRGAQSCIVPFYEGADRDDELDLGRSTNRWDDVYATNGTIQTSDRNEKQDIEELSEAEQRVAVAAKGLLRKFRWQSSVAEKGDDARIHFGIIAQDLQAAFEAEGLDAGRYAMFIHSTWTDEETGEERSRMGVRYSELLAFIIAAI